jgi:hypothetical protein
MHGPYAVANPYMSGIPMTFAQLEYTSNGILVRYQEAVRRRHKIIAPRPLVDQGYLTMIFEIIAAQTGGGEWQDEEKEQRKKRIMDAIQSAKKAPPTEDQFDERWTLEEKTIFCPKVEDIPTAIKVAYDAYLGILSIRKDGDPVFPSGPELGAMA